MVARASDAPEVADLTTRLVAAEARIIDLETQIAGLEAARSHNPMGWTDSF